MTAVDHARRLPRVALKVQRRLWLVQVLFWPTVVISAVGLVAVVARLRGRRQPPPTYRPSDLTSTEPAAAEPELNGHR